MKKIAVKFLFYLVICFVLIISIYILDNFDGALAFLNVLLKLALALLIIFGVVNLVGDIFRFINSKFKKKSDKKIEESLSDDIKSASKSFGLILGAIIVFIIIMFLILMKGIGY